MIWGAEPHLSFLIFISKCNKRLATISVASAIVASTALGSAQPTYASSGGQDSNQNDEVSYMGNTKNPKNVIFLGHKRMRLKEKS